ncbi:unnamed protein product [Plutella xylostella]|uniref:Beta-1,4-N-acetylgalactosaminyltransferase n=1 Tax=Plutella xylostella TaxID=51655 RepID=A0A8S4FRG0_PLUXY|nr:unnamed protein product [Plutella xylostella]
MSIPLVPKPKDRCDDEQSEEERVRPPQWDCVTSGGCQPPDEQHGPVPPGAVFAGTLPAHVLMGGAGAGAGRAARALRLLLLLVLALAAVEYLFGSLLDATPLRTYLYKPQNATALPVLREEALGAVPADKNMHLETVKPSPSWMNKMADSSSVPEKNVSLFSNITSKLNSTGTMSSAILVSKIVDSIKNLVSTEAAEKNETELPVCQDPTDLGPIPVNKTEIELEYVESKYPEVRWGGRYAPSNCTAKHKVAIIVPFRDRLQHLAIFLNHMHPFLMKQQLEYGIFIVEQEGSMAFNRAKLMNVGFVESQKQKAGGWQCHIFHDIDLLPLDSRNFYSCPRQPRHMSASIDTHNYRLLYQDIFGGVSAMTVEQFKNVNGFSNKYWGWGGEDDDMSHRLKRKNYHIARYKMSIARYAMLAHKKSSPNPKR